MENITRYRYSKKNSIVTIIMMLVLGVLVASNIYKAYYDNDKFGLVIFGGGLMLLVFVLVIVIAKRLRPALNNDIILEFNETELIDYLRNITVSWGDIQAVDIRRTRSATIMILRLKWESDHGKDISISLRWVEGNDRDIYNMALTYFNNYYREVLPE
jgi:hypothetical protein